MHTNFKEQARIFKAFCDENRLQILGMLRSGEKCACVLLEKLEIRQPALSYHMKILVQSKVVKSRQAGKWTYYSISESGSEYALSLLKELTTPEANILDESSCSAELCGSSQHKGSV